MSAAVEHMGCQIHVECKEHPATSRPSLWSASFQYCRDGVVVQPFVQACARQKTAGAAHNKALRFAIIAIDTRAEASARAAPKPVAARRRGTLGSIAEELGYASELAAPP